MSEPKPRTPLPVRLKRRSIEIQQEYDEMIDETLHMPTAPDSSEIEKET